MNRFRVLADLPVSPVVLELLGDRVELVPWDSAGQIDAVYTYGHPTVDAAILDRLAGVMVVSNFGVGVDHIDVPAATARGIPVGNTPGILDGATADLAFALLLAAGRRVVEGDRYARGPDFTHYDPSLMLGREIHGSTLGIFGMGRIGRQVAKRAQGFGMTVLYHNRNRSDEAEVAPRHGTRRRTELLAASDYLVLTVPLTPRRGVDRPRGTGEDEADRDARERARGAVVDKDALAEALREKKIHAAALDVTDPEPLPRDHALLKLKNVIITPHLGSATEETRRRMAEVSVENLFAGLERRELPFRVNLPGQ